MYNIANDKDTLAVMAKYPIIKEFCNTLHGSGIDYEYYAIENKHDITLFNAFHCMNDCGMYVCSQNFKIVIPKSDITDFKVYCTDKSRYWWNTLMLKEYLEDTIASVFYEIFKRKNNIPPIKSGFRVRTAYEIVEVKAIWGLTMCEDCFNCQKFFECKREDKTIFILTSYAFNIQENIKFIESLEG